MHLILHISSRDRWTAAQAAGEYRDPSLETEGFIHCSTAAQAARTGNRFFKGQTGLVLLCIDADKLTNRWLYEDASHPAPVTDENPTPRPEQFPHVYGPINLDAVLAVEDFGTGADGDFVLPEAVQKLASAS